MVPVPVRAHDADARLDLQAALDRIYDDAGYADYIYEGSPRPRLGKKDAEWARALLSAAAVAGEGHEPLAADLARRRSFRSAGLLRTTRGQAEVAAGAAVAARP